MNARIRDTRSAELRPIDLPLLAAVVGLPTRAVQTRIFDADHDATLQAVFEPEWPGDAATLGRLTVQIALRAGLEEELVVATALGLGAVSDRLASCRGRMLLRNAFPELSRDEDDARDRDGEEGDPGEEGFWRYRDGRTRFTVRELIGATQVRSVRDAPRFTSWLAASASLPVAKLRRRLSRAHPRTGVAIALGEAWPPELILPPRESIAELTCGLVVRSPALVRLVADVARTSPAVTYELLRAIAPELRIDFAFPDLAGPEPSTQRSAVPPVPPPRSTAAHALLGGKYQLGKMLAEGATGKVYAATRQDLPHHRVVVKLAIPGSPASLKDEIGHAFDLSHEHICAYKDFGHDPVFGTYLVMQHGGRSLRHLLEHEGPLPLPRALDVLHQAALGLDYAHRHGVLHQDVEPGNVLVGDDDTWEIRIADFGAAVRRDPDKDPPASPRPLSASPGYAAPEQRAGLRAHEASDQYALALVFCSMLEGELFETPPMPRGYRRLSSAQNAALLRALDDDPLARFPSCVAFAEAMAETRSAVAIDQRALRNVRLYR